MESTRFLARNGALSAGQIVLTTLGMFVVYRNISADLGLDALGAWTVCLSLAGLAALFDLGASDAMVRQIAARSHDTDSRASLFATSLVLCGFGGLCGALLLAWPLWQVVVAVSDGAHPALATFFVGAFAVVILNTLAMACTGVLEGLERYDTKLLIAAGSVATLIVASETLIPRLAYTGMLLAFLLQALASALLGFAFAARGVRPGAGARLRPSVASARELVRVGFPIKSFGLVNFALEPLARLAVVHFGGLHTAGLYELAARLAGQARLLVVGATQAALPRFVVTASRGEAEARATHALAARLNAWTSTSSFVLLVLAAPWISLWLTGEVNVRLVAYVAMLSIGWWFNAVSAPYFFANIAELALSRVWISTTIMALTNLLLGLTLGSAFGPDGVVAGLALAVVLGSLYTIFSRRTGVVGVYRWPETLTGLSGLAAVGACYLSGTITRPSYLEHSIYATVAFAVAAALCAAVLFRSLHATPQG